MLLKIHKKINYKKTLYKCVDNCGVDYVLVDNTDVLTKGFIYDITVFWIDKGIKRVFSLAEYKDNFLDNEKGLTDAFNDNKKKFPCNCKYGWKDFSITPKDIMLLE